MHDTPVCIQILYMCDIILKLYLLKIKWNISEQIKEWPLINKEEEIETYDFIKVCKSNGQFLKV